MLAVNDIHWYSTENEDIKASVVKRFNRTLKTKMLRYFTYKNLPRYIDVLPRLIASYNASSHRRTERDERDGTSKWAIASA